MRILPRTAAAAPRGRHRLLGIGTVVSLGVALTASGGTLAQAAATPAASPAPALGSATSGGSVIVILKNQHSNLNLRTQGKQRMADAHSNQAPIVASIKAHGGTNVVQLVSVNAVAAHVSAAEVARLRSDPAVARIVPDVNVPVPQTPAPKLATKVAPATHQASCPASAAGPGKPVQEPEAMADIHASTGNPNSPDMANSIATGKGVIVAIGGMNQLAGNPNFQRADGSHVVIDAPDYTADKGSDESYGDASSVAAQGNVVYHYAQALPFSGLPASCTFVIKGDAPGASLVDSSMIDTPPSNGTMQNPTESEAQIVAGIDNAVITEHADVISESFGFSNVPGSYAIHYAANDAAVAAGVTVVVSAGDAGDSGTVSSPATDPEVIAAGAVDNFRLVAMAHGYSGYVSNNIAALSSGGTTPNNKLVDLVAPGYFGEAACADGSGGCPPNYPTESMRGTSESAPLIAGAAADVIQAYRDSHGGASPTPAMVKELLTSTATDIDAPADEQGAGLLNIYAAVRAAQQMPGATGASTGKPGKAGSAASLIASPSQLDISGNGGTLSSQSVSLYNTGNSATTVTGSYRWIGAEHQIGRTVTENISAPNPALPVPAEGAQAATPITFTVPRGLNRLDADMIWPDPTNSNILCIALFDPQGRLEQLSYDDGSATRNGVSNIQHAEVTNPEPGRWTAKILWSGTDQDLALGPAVPGTYTGPMSFKVSGQNYLTSPATGPVTIRAHASASVPLRISMPVAPGDHPESVQFSARSQFSPGGGAATSLPVARRTLIPANGGQFQTLITSSVGRSVGQISTYNIDVPAGRPDLDVTFHTADASADNKYTFYLINPSGTVVTKASTPQTVNGQPVATADLETADPVAGVWEIDVELNLTVSGKEFTQTVFGDATDSP
jgi:hypothetical protein